MSVRQKVRSVQLLESDVLGVLPEALAAHVQAVLPDETVAVGASAAEKKTAKMIISNMNNLNANDFRERNKHQRIITRHYPTIGSSLGKLEICHY